MLTKEMITGKTRTCGLLGNPVEHTLSPLIHNHLAQMKGIDMVYVPFLVQPKEVEHAVKGAYGLNLLGLNVTVPYKSEVMRHLVAIDELAQDIGAVNTLVAAEGGYKGYNTDMTGLYRAMCAEQIVLKGAEVVILGAGGAARAVAYMCAAYEASHIYILNRTVAKAKLIADEINQAMQAKGKWQDEKITPLALADYKTLPQKQYLAIQSTSVGLHPNIDEVVIDDAEFYKQVSVGFDLIYKPEKTKFMQCVEEAGGLAYNGLKMLLYQGVNAFELWNGVTVSEQEAMEVYTLLKDAVRV